MFTVYQGCLTRESQRLSVRPFVEANFSWPTAGTAKVTVENRGIGPAEIGHLKVDVDGKPLYSWRQVLKNTGIVSDATSFLILRAGTALPPAAPETLIEVHGVDAQSAFRSAFNRIHIEICYCSMHHECWLFSLPKYSHVELPRGLWTLMTDGPQYCTPPVHEVDE